MLNTRRITTTAALGVGIVIVAGAGIATAASGKALLLGKSNSARAVTTLSNAKGTALSLKAKAGKPALQVNTKAQIPNLNASLLGGRSASSFQPRFPTTEQCNQQPGSNVTGFGSTGLQTCSSTQAVQNGRVTGTDSPPSLFVRTGDAYLLFANLNVQNIGSTAGDFTCKIAWSDSDATGETEADQTQVTNLDPADGDTMIALGTSGAHQIPAGVTLAAVCTSSTPNATPQIDGGDITAMPLSFQ